MSHHEPYRCPEVLGARGGYSTARAGGGHVARPLLHVDFWLHAGSRRARHRSVSALAGLDEQALCGEFIPAFSRLGTCMGLGDVDGVRRELTIVVSEAMPPSRLWVPSGPLLWGNLARMRRWRGCSMRGTAGRMPVLCFDPPFMDSDPLNS